jgi:hypothetical protein
MKDPGSSNSPMHDNILNKLWVLCSALRQDPKKITASMLDVKSKSKNTYIQSARSQSPNMSFNV